MTASLKAHPFAALFPHLPPEELAHLARDIKERGLLEPIILYQGLILDGRNRYRACQLAGVKPRLEEFDPKSAKRTPEEYVLSRNLRRRHLSIGQKAAIALDWSEQMQFHPVPEKNKGRGRPKGPVSEAAKHVGVNEQRVFEVRQIRDTNLRLYEEVKTGRRSLNAALVEIHPAKNKDTNGFRLEGESGASDAFVDFPVPDEEVHGKTRRDTSKTNSKEFALAAKVPPSPAAVDKALTRIKSILGNWFYAEVKARNLIEKAEEIVQFSKLTDGQILGIAPLLKKGWKYEAAFRQVVDQLTPDDDIRALHSRALEEGGNWALFSVGNFSHLVVWGPEKEETLARIKEALAEPAMN